MIQRFARQFRAPGGDGGGGGDDAAARAAADKAAADAAAAEAAKKTMTMAEVEELTKGLKTNAAELLREKKAAEARAKAYEKLGKTPEEIQSALEAQAKVEEQRLLDSGKWREATAAREAQLIEAATKREAELNGKLTKRDGQLFDVLARNEAQAAIVRADGRLTLLEPHVIRNLKVVEEEGEPPRVQVVDGKGVPRIKGTGQPMTVDDLVLEMRANKDFESAFNAPDARGGGGRGSGDRPGGNGQFRLSWEDRNDSAKYRALKEAATKAGQQVVIDQAPSRG